MTILYRNTVPGHVQIHGEYRFSPPLLEAQNLTGHPHHWDKFHSQNIEVEAFLERYFPRVVYLDVYTSTVLRRDSYCVKDGLHYCIPGPIDEWVVLLFNTMKLLTM